MANSANTAYPNHRSESLPEFRVGVRIRFIRVQIDQRGESASGPR